MAWTTFRSLESLRTSTSSAVSVLYVRFLAFSQCYNPFIIPPLCICADSVIRSETHTHTHQNPFGRTRGDKEQNQQRTDGKMPQSYLTQFVHFACRVGVCSPRDVEKVPDTIKYASTCTQLEPFHLHVLSYNCTRKGSLQSTSSPVRSLANNISQAMNLLLMKERFCGSFLW